MPPGTHQDPVPPPDVLQARLAEEQERRRRAEQALHDLEARHRLLIEGAKEYGIILLDPAGRIASWNEGARRLVGYEAAEVVGRPAALLFTPEDHARGLPERELKTAAAAGRCEDENWTVRKDGSRFWASGISTSVPDDRGGVRGFVKVFRDLTERRQAQEALRERDGRLRVALAAAHMGTWLWDLREDRNLLDESLTRLLGLPAGEKVRSLEDFLRLIHPDERPAVADAFARAVRDGAGIRVEFRVVWPDGSVHWLRDQGDVLRDEQGRPLYLAGACADITERKDLEDALRRSHEELERRVEERTADLLRAQRRALEAERLAAIGQTMAGLAHESGNALQRGQTYLDRLRWRLQDRPEALALLEELQKAQNDLVRLYEDVRGYAAPIQLDLRPCDVAAAWRGAWEKLAPAREGRDARLEENLGTADRMCTADGFRLEQVFRNVFDNALAAGTDPVVVRVTCSEAALGGRPALRVAVRDNGPGLTAEQRQRLFEPLYTTKPQGTGLGLPISRRIVEAHGGTIEVAAGAGPGAELVITLPRSKA